MHRRWAMVRQAWTASRAYQLAWGLRDLLALKHSQAAVHGVSQEEGMLLWQNAASKAMFGGCTIVWNSNGGGIMWGLRSLLALMHSNLHSQAVVHGMSQEDGMLLCSRTCLMLDERTIVWNSK